ncbi:gp179 [Synechococcus phage syn9]|uniref:Gp179 n=1 Tax=Synechococcus phage syn9 TaxID=382359 RepID=Q0QZ46_BPSYS|nr:gp179 [Synechococcus phage syn9]ABA47150.1 gp179 [Synechococcus phage syn9]AGH56499.1 hypothetical protein CPUG_00005 [Cyanophage Syn10]
MKYTEEALVEAVAALGWDVRNDDIHVEIGGTQVSGIHQPEGYNEKWSSPKGHRKYNKDAFIVIKNQSRTPFAPSVNNDPERKGHHIQDATGQSSKTE